MARRTAFLLDFDGVVADSELLSNTVLAEHLTALGRPTTVRESLARYCGRRMADVLQRVEADLGEPPPPDFADALGSEILRRLGTEVRPVPGVTDFLARFPDTPRAVASSSSRARLAICIRTLGLSEALPMVVSADEVVRGKPAPDVFLAAAERLGVAPADCLVFEDGAAGVEAAVAAGMRAVALLAGSHATPDLERALREAGAWRVAHDWSEGAEWADAFLSDPSA